MMRNKLLIFIYLVVCLFVTSCENDEKDELLLGAIDVGKQAPLTLTYQESLTDAKLNIPFYYFLKEESQTSTPSFIKNMDGLKSYKVYSYFGIGPVGNIYVFDNTDDSISVDDIFDGGSAVSLIFEDSDSYKILYSDKNIIIYSGRDFGGMLYLLYHGYDKESSRHIVYTTNKNDALSMSGKGDVVILESYEKHDLVYPIVDDLRMIKGLTAKEVDTSNSLLPWVEYEKELPLNNIKLHTDAIPEIREIIFDLDIDDSKRLNVNRLLPIFTFVAINNNDASLGMFNEQVTDKKLWNYLKRADNGAISKYQKQSKEIDTIYTDERNLIVSFGNSKNSSQYIYLSVSKLSLKDITILISMRTTTEPMARFYLSYFNHVQDITNNSASP